ncbi:ShlB/FhaC/HecB family hemolysin secretion/activation protein [Vibrio pectenicida]|uniref:ShlB/FhaC/HecB family hemolysin secretion/activation protein n=1 Tax=Vibrio pectenicida TaxID=62763 RepID=A0A3R9FJX1_9VIBR|nr:ShlB/FhaC/HecB family hemolysin secretion/activation protein [Vibrio pectenicida]RSD29742.1 ShlB/FhaC/HecB family hemolysin secretion/activation protein [Vibrio pectenicida]
MRDFYYLNTIKTTLILLATLLAVAKSQAANPPISSQVDQNSRRVLQENQRQLNKQLQPKPTKGPAEEGLKEVTAEGNPVLQESAKCLPITGVYVTDTTLLSEKDFAKLTPIANDCILAEDVNRLIRELTGLYISKGYVTARVLLLQPGVYGELGLEIMEGEIEGILGASETVNIDTLFPDLVGQPLNLRDLEQGLDQANRLHSNKVSMRLLPGEYRGSTVVELINPPATRWNSNASIDNYGQESTGRNVLRAMTVYSSPFGMSDYISLSGSTTLESNPEVYSRSVSALYSIPYGYWTLSSFGFYSGYSTENNSTNNTVNIHGWSSLLGMRLDRTISRDGNQINTISGQINYKQAKNFVETIQFDINSQDLAVLSLDYSHLRILSTGVVSAGIGIDRGTSLFGANTESTAVDEHFTKLRGNITTSYYFKMLEDTYLYRNRLVGQFSQHIIPGVEWIGISDSSAVRGLDINNLSSSDGWYLRNTLSRDINVTEWIFTPRLGLDYGQVDTGIEESGFDKAVGISIGQRATYKQASFDLEVSKAWILNSPEYKQESVLVLARLELEF